MLKIVNFVLFVSFVVQTPLQWKPLESAMKS